MAETDALLKDLQYSSKGLGSRHVLVVMCSVSLMLVVSSRINMSIAIVAMVNHSVVRQASSSSNLTDCGTFSSASNNQIKNGPFIWDIQVQGFIIGAFFYGYVVSQVIVGSLADRYGGKKFLCIGLFMTSLITALTPFAAFIGDYQLLFITRLLQGTFEGFVTPSIYSLCGKWAPPLERTIITTFIFAFVNIGSAFGSFFSGLLCNSDFLGGWPSSFYIFGGLGILWVFLTLCFVYDTPSSHPRISINELKYLEQTLGSNKAKTIHSIDWVKAIKSLALWSTFLAHFSNNWLLYLVFTSMPLYYNEILGLSTSKSGLFMAVPYVVIFFTMTLSAKLVDTLRQKGVISTVMARKLTSLWSLPTAVIFIAVGYAGCDVYLTLALIVLSLAVRSVAAGNSHAVSYVDMAPKCTGGIAGIGNTMGNIPGILVPFFVGEMRKYHQGITEWQIIFYTSAGITAFGGIMYFFFVEGHEQEWAKTKETPYEDI